MSAPVDIADFRSDTVTQPHAAMRQAMATALVGDDVLCEDPTIHELENKAAAFLGQESSLFVPSGTMANQIAIHVHCRPGDELICEERSHVFLYEGGSIARLSGTQVRMCKAEGGFPSPDQIESLIRTSDVHYPTSRLLVIENTHNMAGGRVLDRAGMASRIEVAGRHGLRVHVDGARLANAMVATGTPASELVAGVDSVSLCFSKGLGAPVGSVVAGSGEFVDHARRVRKALGGGMRQAGILAAAALMALEEGPALLAEDHRRARRLAEGLANLRFVVAAKVESNILMLDLTSGSPEDLLEFLAARGIRSDQVAPGRLRFVTHRDLGDEHVERCIQAVTDWTHQRSA